MAAAVINRRYTISTGTWTPVVAPQDCSYIHLQNEDASNNVAMRTDKDDPGTARTLYPLQNFTFGSAQVVFAAGSTVIWVLASSGTGPVVATFVR